MPPSPPNQPLLRLKLLGGATLESDAGIVSGRAVQRRRLALLALLAAAPARTMSRDKVVALLWPESSTEDARHLLSVTIHELRRLLGESLLITRGDDLILDGGQLRTDVEDFVEAVSSGDAQQAVTLYGGPFMDGVHIADAQEFEDWAQAERDRLARMLGGALEDGARAQAAAGNPRGAVDLWRRLAVHDPYNSRVARELIHALIEAGDRAGALQHARVHSTLMREEFGVEPDQESAQLLTSLKEPLAAPPAVPPAAPPAAAPVEPAVAVQPSTGGRRPPRLMMATALAGVILLGAVLVPVLLLDRDPPPPERATVAVLPFRNIGGADSLNYFSDGLTEEVLLALGRVDSLEVIGRTSAFALRDLDPREVGTQLDVRHVLTGTVRTGGARLKVTATLIDAKRGVQLWTQSYEPPLRSADILAVQEDIARAVVRELAPRLGAPLATAALVPSGTDNLDAKRLFWNGRMNFERRTPEHLLLALSFFKRAAEADPDYALAHAAIAEVYTILGAYDYGALPPAEAFPLARKSAELALRLDPQLAEAHAALGNVAFNYGWDWAAADREFRSAITLNKSYAPAYHWYALYLITRGRQADARQAIMRAREVEALSPVVRTGLARHYYLSRDYPAALDEYQRVIAQDSQFVTAHAGIGLTYAAMGNYADALRHYRYALKIGQTPAPVLHGLIGHAAGLSGDRATALASLATLNAMRRTRFVPAEWFVLTYIGLRQPEDAVRELEQAYANRSGALPYLTTEPVVDPIKADPRVQKLIAQLGLAPATRTPSR